MGSCLKTLGLTTHSVNISALHTASLMSL